MHLTPKQRRILSRLDEVRSYAKKGTGNRYKFILDQEDCSLQVASLAARGLIRRLQSGRLCKSASRLGGGRASPAPLTPECKGLAAGHQKGRGRRRRQFESELSTRAQLLAPLWKDDSSYFSLGE